MTKSYPFSEIQEKLANSQKVIIALGQNPRYDQIASALALSLSFEQVGKSVSVVCPSPMTVEFNNLVGVDRISSKIKGTDLVVTFNYSMEDVEKISYNDDNGKLNLVLQPKTGAPSINEKAVNFSYAGIGADLIFTVGLKNIGQLDSLGLGSISPETVVNIDNRSDNTNFAQINIIDADSSSLSEMVLGLIEGLRLPVDADTAQNLLNGIWRETNGLKKSEIGADTYEAVASCLRLGAQKPIDQPSRPQESFRPKPSQAWPRQRNIPQPMARVEKKVVDMGEEQPQIKNPPSDWFEPKIYKGSSNV